MPLHSLQSLPGLQHPVVKKQQAVHGRLTCVNWGISRCVRRDGNEDYREQLNYSAQSYKRKTVPVVHHSMNPPIAGFRLLPGRKRHPLNVTVVLSSILSSRQCAAVQLARIIHEFVGWIGKPLCVVGLRSLISWISRVHCEFTLDWLALIHQRVRRA